MQFALQIKIVLIDPINSMCYPMVYNQNYMDLQRIDELRALAHESPASFIEIYRTDLLELIDLAEAQLKFEAEIDDNS